MHNARLVERRTPNKEPSSGYPDISDQEALNRNIDACVPLLKAMPENSTIISNAKGAFAGLVGTVNHETMIGVLEKLTWANADTFDPDYAWIASLPAHVLKEWRVIFPQQKKRKRVNLRGVGDFSIHGRKVERHVRIRGNAESLHRDVIDELSLTTPNTGYALVYPIMDADKVNDAIPTDGYPQGVVMAFRLRLPGAATPTDRQPLIYKVHVRSKPLYAIVDDQQKGSIPG
jgi:hypothetical protein